jgi:UDP-N-acetylglucosamine 2-epimerase (hydrolysing)
MSKNKKILFLTGTRADFGKLKPLIRVVNEMPGFEASIFATGMHMISKYGFTVGEIHAAGFEDVYTFINQMEGEKMEQILANTISGFSRYVHEYRPDLIVVHGDRIETLAGATVGALRNIRVAHVEGGEISGTVDELIRHSVSKLSHIHFVSNQEAADRLKRLGERPESIYTIGSADIDIMLGADLPNFPEAKKHYDFTFDRYGIVIFHPVTTELDQIRRDARELVCALIESQFDYLVIHPNNDEGSSEIFSAYEKLKGNDRFRIYPSIRFEFFLTFLKNAAFIIGNSSAGVREAPVYGIPTVSVGSRQQNRYDGKSIVNVAATKDSILDALRTIQDLRFEPSRYFGDGNSRARFREVLENPAVWGVPLQKRLYE